MNIKQIQDEQVPKGKCICPWRIAPLLDNFLRSLIHNPRKLFGPYVQPGMTVLDIGCGGGFTSLGLARLLGNKGLVISADIQPQMLDIIQERALKAGISSNIRTHLCEANRIGITDELDFVVALFMVHEVPDSKAFLKELFALLKPGGQLFLAEPMIHVSRHDFERTVAEAQAIGFEVSKRPSVRIGRAVILVKPVIEDW